LFIRYRFHFIYLTLFYILKFKPVDIIIFLFIFLYLMFMVFTSIKSTLLAMALAWLLLKCYVAIIFAFVIRSWDPCNQI
jgi:hypothetical protein